MANQITPTILNGIRSLWIGPRDEVVLPALRPTLAVTLTWVAGLLTWAGLAMCAVVLAIGAASLLPAIGRDLRSDLEAQEAEQIELQRLRKERRGPTSTRDQWRLAGGHVIQLVPLDTPLLDTAPAEPVTVDPPARLPKRGLHPVVVHGVFLDDRRAA